MAIRKRLTRRVLFTGIATAATIGATAGVALAVAITFTITPGGAITANGWHDDSDRTPTPAAC